MAPYVTLPSQILFNCVATSCCQLYVGIVAVSSDYLQIIHSPQSYCSP